MGNTNTLADIGLYGMVVAGILVMTRPGSQGPKLVTALTNGYASIAKSVTGQK